MRIKIKWTGYAGRGGQAVVATPDDLGRFLERSDVRYATARDASGDIVGSKEPHPDGGRRKLVWWAKQP